MSELTIQEVHTYLELSDRQMVPKLECPVNSDHMGMLAELDEHFEVYLYCLACGAKVKPGWNLTQKIRNGIKQNRLVLS